jgi:hypothetical protein
MAGQPAFLGKFSWSKVSRFSKPEHRDAGLALQLRSSFYVGSAGFGLMCASPEGPCDDVGGPDASLRKTNSDAPDFLN